MTFIYSRRYSVNWAWINRLQFYLDSLQNGNSLVCIKLNVPRTTLLQSLPLSQVDRKNFHRHVLLQESRFSKFHVYTTYYKTIHRNHGSRRANPSLDPPACYL